MRWVERCIKVCSVLSEKIMGSIRSRLLYGSRGVRPRIGIFACTYEDEADVLVGDRTR